MTKDLMTIRSLFAIVLKILGIIFIKNIIDLVPQLISAVTLYADSDSREMQIFLFISLFLILVVYILIAYLLIFQTNLIIDRLKLDKGFSEDSIQLNVHRSTVLKITVIVIGGLLVVNEIPRICGNLYYYFEQKKLTHGQARPSLVNIVVPGLKILTGMLLMSESRRIVNLIEYRRRK